MLKNLIKKPVRVLISFFGQRFEKLFNKSINRDEVNKILVFQTGGIGDILRIFPLLEALRYEFPNAKIDTLTEYPPDIFTLMDKKNVINQNLLFDFKGKSFLKKMLFILELRKSAYDLVISPSRGSGMLECSIIAFLIGKKWRAGFIKKGIGFLYTNKIDFQDSVSILMQNMNLLKTIGIKKDMTKASININVTHNSLLYAKEILKGLKAKGRKIVAISPFVTNHPELFEWPLENFIELSKHLISKRNASVILLGSKKDYKMSCSFEEKLDEKKYFINLVGKTDLLKVCALIKSSDIFIGNDSGLLHIANIFEIPSIGIFGPSSVEQVLSNSNEKTIIINHKAPCSPCYVHQPDFDFKCKFSNNCLKYITVEDVTKAMDNLIQ
ncbi:MAG: glycosyltransferase family 9 protein [Nitrospirae bacterium]|nr:glycosyltransferase family 9 protein [Nitrospirota bacterium]